MKRCQSPDSANCKRNFNPKSENIVLDFCVSQTSVVAASCGIRVHAGLHSAEVISGSQNHCVNSVHNAFVVRYGTVRFGFGYFNGTDKFFGKLFSIVMLCGEVFNLATYLSTHQTFGNVVGKDAHNDLWKL